MIPKTPAPTPAIARFHPPAAPGNPNNSVMPAIRVNTVNATPLPSAAWIGLIGCAMGAAFHKKFTRKKFTTA